MATSTLNPALPVNDARNNRITTDILVSGYIRATGINDIPSEIIHLCFLFWFIDVCDVWDISKSNPEAKFKGQCVTADIENEFMNLFTVYGSQIIDSGECEWRIKCKAKASRLAIGLIEDKDAILTANQNGFTYGMRGQGCFAYSNGKFFYSKDASDDIRNFVTPFNESGTIITMTLDMKRQSVRYKINDQDFGYVDAKCVKKDQKYRLAVTFSSKEGNTPQIELL